MKRRRAKITPNNNTLYTRDTKRSRAMKSRFLVERSYFGTSSGPARRITPPVACQAQIIEMQRRSGTVPVKDKTNPRRDIFFFLVDVSSLCENNAAWEEQESYATQPKKKNWRGIHLDDVCSPRKPLFTYLECPPGAQRAPQSEEPQGALISLSKARGPLIASTPHGPP